MRARNFSESQAHELLERPSTPSTVHSGGASMESVGSARVRQVVRARASETILSLAWKTASPAASTVEVMTARGSELLKQSGKF